MAEYDRYEAPMTPGARWPDGSPVSNWSQAVATLARYGSVMSRAQAQHVIPQQDPDRQVESELVLVAA
jgi:hypothetical protein